MAHAISCWFQGVGLVLLVSLSYLAIMAVFLTCFALLITGGQKLTKHCKFNIEKPLRFLWRGAVVVLIAATVSAVVLVSKETVCQRGFWKSYSAAFGGDKAK